MNKTFDQLADELHTELIKYYGGEFGYLMAILSTRQRDTNNRLKQFFAECFGPVIDMFEDMIR